MNQIYPDEGLHPLLALLVAGEFTWHLFTNDITPDRDTVLDDFAEADWDGYLPVTLTADDLTLFSVNNHVGTVTGEPVEYSNVSGLDQQAFGYFVTDQPGGHVVACGRFDDAPLVITPLGQFFVQPVLSVFSQFHS